MIGRTALDGMPSRNFEVCLSLSTPLLAAILLRLLFRLLSGLPRLHPFRHRLLVRLRFRIE